MGGNSIDALYALIGAAVTAMAAIGGAYLKTWTDRRRIDKVEAPTTAADAWAKVFEVTHQTMLDMRGDIARLEQRLNDQDEEHRIELIERDRVMTAREQALQHCSDALRRLRSYVAVVTDLLIKNGIAFPPPPEDIDEVAPERRVPVPTVTAVVESDKPKA